MSLFLTEPATSENSVGTIAEALTAHEKAATAILRRAGYTSDKPGDPKHWLAALGIGPRRRDIHRAARRLVCIRDCRAAIASHDAEAAAWAAFVLAELYGQDRLDAFEKPIRHGAKLHKTRQENPGRGKAEGIAAAAELARAALPKGTAKALWRWIHQHAKAGAFTAGGHRIEAMAAGRVAQIDAAECRRSVSQKAFENGYAPAKRI